MTFGGFGGKRANQWRIQTAEHSLPVKRAYRPRDDVNALGNYWAIESADDNNQLCDSLDRRQQQTID